MLVVVLTACGTDGAPEDEASTTSTPTTASTMTMADDTMDDGTDHIRDDDEHDHMNMTREVDPAHAPTVSNLRVTPIASGWLVEFDVTGHEFSEEAKDGPHVDGQGHGHLYVDGTKLATIFGPMYLIDQLPAGEHTISVTLNANDHATLTLNDEPIGAMTMLVVEEDLTPTARITLVDGEPTEGIVRIEVAQGDSVVLEVVSDVSDEVHVHGLDVYGNAVAGDTLVMTFEAALAGIWEIELEGSHTQIAELVVNP